MQTYAIQTVQCPCHFSKVNEELPRRIEPDILLYLFGCCNSLLSKTNKEHFKHLHVVFYHLWEPNLSLIPTKCEFFWDVINYLAWHASKEGMWPSKENLKSVAGFAPPQTYMEIWAFLDFVGHYRQFIKGFACIVQPLHEHLSGAGACKKSEQVILTAEAKDAFETLKKSCHEAPVLAFADFDKPFFLETDATKCKIRSCAIPKIDLQLIQSGNICKPISNYSWA